MPSLPQTLILLLSTLSLTLAAPAPAPVPDYTATTSAAAPAATTDNSALIKDLLTAPTAIKRFQRLLTAAGQALLSPAELRNIVVFDFNNAVPAPGAKGGATKAGMYMPFSFSLPLSSFPKPPSLFLNNMFFYVLMIWFCYGI